MNLSALKVLLEKEVNARKSYVEGLELVDGILGLEQNKRDVQNAVDRIKAERADVLNELAVAKSTLENIKKQADDVMGKARAEAENLVDDALVRANKKAAEITDSAKAAADKATDHALAKLDRVNADIESLAKEYKENLAAAEISRKELAEINAALDAAKEKFRKILGE